MGMFTESIEVTRAADGMPLRVSWQGQGYRLVAEPQRWFERRKWWDENLGFLAEPVRGLPTMRCGACNWSRCADPGKCTALM